MNNLKKLGFNEWFNRHVNPEKSKCHSIARITSVHKESYTVAKGEKDVFAELTGNLLYSYESISELPTIGDWVYADFYDDDTHATILDILPRKTLLKRKSAGKLVDFQLIAANIDVAFIIQSLDENFNLNRLERYLVMVNEARIKPIILLSKCDLLPQEQIDNIKQKVIRVIDKTSIFEFSNLNKKNIDLITNSLKSTLTYCLLGSSGVGKTSLLNSILGNKLFETQSVSKIRNKGKHTTTSRQLVYLQNGAMIIDTPGMRELGNISVNNGLDDTFSEILALSQNCKFNDCSHRVEKGCAILAAIEAGKLSEHRYQSYLKIKKESDFNQMSYLEKRKKSKSFGKMVKSIMKDKKRQ